MDISTQDIFVVLLLVFLEGILSLDNALVLALLVRHLPQRQQRKALTFGIAGAILFRILALFFVTELIRLTWVKFVGGGYLVILGVKELLKKEDSNETDVEKIASHASFWKTVVLVELADVAFAVDSILAAVALSSKLWILITGGILGIIMMRFAASIFGRLLDRFPELEKTAYFLIILVGTKLIVEGLKIPGVNFHDMKGPAFWIFWSLMLFCVLYGFVSKRDRKKL